MPILIGLAAGVAVAWCWTGYVSAVGERRAEAAALWDGAIVATSYGMLQFWAVSSNDWMILAGYALGQMLGTYTKVRRG